MNEQDVRTLLDDLANTPPPAPRVDVAHAMTTARRRARTRAWTSAAAAVLVVGVAAGLTYTVIDRPSPATGVSPTVAAPVTRAPQRFDPLVRYASFGWLPEKDRLTWRNTSITGEKMTLTASEYLPDPANGPNAALPAAYVDVRLYAAGAVPQTEQPMQVQSPDGTKIVNYGPTTDAPAVNGAPAYWVGTPGDPETVILKWRYAPDGWAEMSAARFPGDLRETMHRIAGELRVGGTELLRFPFHLTGLSPDLVPTASQFTEGGIDGPWQASLDVGIPQGPTLSVAVQPTATADSEEPNIAVDGHPARHVTFEGDHLGVPQYSDRLFVADLLGLQAKIFIDATTAAAAAPLGQDGVLGIFRALTVHPDTADWTDQPLR